MDDVARLLSTGSNDVDDTVSTPSFMSLKRVCFCGICTFVFLNLHVDFIC